MRTLHVGVNRAAAPSHAHGGVHNWVFCTDLYCPQAGRGVFCLVLREVLQVELICTNWNAAVKM